MITSSYWTSNRQQPTASRTLGNLLDGSMETPNTFPRNFGSSVQFTPQSGEARRYQDANRMYAADLAIFHNPSDTAELSEVCCNLFGFL